MIDAPERESPVEQVFDRGWSQRVGWYRFYFADERWEWSPQVEQTHGYTPGTASPTTSLVLSHNHPDDHRSVAETLAKIRRTHNPFSTRHRIITVQGQTRDVVVIGERLHDDAGAVIGTQGFYFDVTYSDTERQASISEAIADIADNRAAIEQAKGVLMYVYRIGAEAAFDLLRWRSQETNVKLRWFAEQLLADVRALKPDAEPLPSRVTFDQLLLTTHQRMRTNTPSSRRHPPGA